jgi:hypothetical protein
MESLQENRPLFYSIIFSMGALMSLLMGLIPDVSNQFEIVEFPQQVRALHLFLLLAWFPLLEKSMVKLKLMLLLKIHMIADAMET